MLFRESVLRVNGFLEREQRRCAREQPVSYQLLMDLDHHGRRADLERSNDGSRSPRSFLRMYQNKYKKHPRSRTYTNKYE